MGVAKAEVIQTLRESTGILFDMPTSQGGNTNNGNIAVSFSLLICVTKYVLPSAIQYTEKTLACYCKSSMFFSPLFSRQKNKINPEKLRVIGYNLQIFLKTNFPWAAIKPTDHTMASHYWQLVQLNNGNPISVYSEQGSEAMNKAIRAIKSGTSCRARQMNLQVNTRDIFIRMWFRSHPVVALQRRILRCSRCDSVGHTARSCQADINLVQSYEASMIN